MHAFAMGEEGGRGFPGDAANHRGLGPSTQSRQSLTEMPTDQPDLLSDNSKLWQLTILANQDTQSPEAFSETHLLVV